VTRFFIRPQFGALRAASLDEHGEVYAGALTIGDFAGRTTTLSGRVWRAGDRVRILAEYDVADAERVDGALLELNRRYADGQLELAQANLRLRQNEAAIVALSLTDQLTGAGNRRRLEEALPVEVGRAKRTGDILCAFMADLDRFKRVNDEYGHAAGDVVLRAFGGLLRRLTRPTDVVARFGGEEFVVLMPQTKLEDALTVAERIRESLAAMTIDPLPAPVTVSIGVAQAGRDEAPDALLRRIDQALYAAKDAGRNRVIVASRPGRHFSDRTSALAPVSKPGNAAVTGRVRAQKDRVSLPSAS